ncbi:hypothetical protein Mal15_38160 [Stieleria maiorica]|uniref:Uncharacterized protein n=1 Tax=Stieleria maiorica TaxID=2795974 RepID=A0A5B9MIH3_9BACT|nr:hypothetical protein [Stieleria maiorica]QEF99750.1 hypothetical protein Mal15_38160 [Stieleria maiorica]
MTKQQQTGRDIRITGPDDPGLILKTQADVARAFDVERSTVHSWVQKGMPGSPGRYNYAHIMRWLFAFGPWRSEAARDEMLWKHITE